MALKNGAPSTMSRQFPSSAAASLVLPRSVTKSVYRNDIGRRGLLTLLVSTATVPEVADPKKALLQEYLKRSKENKAKNDKERLDDYYKRNYKDYFEFIEGSVKDKKEELLSESEKDILKWLKKNRK
ncbi:Photosystem I reaction centre subunit N (PSAN or PSI-N) [Musa troglodytarum]|uniref:Photosystem I reaction centre subunit N (PSAN or PSI-N) n=1 Tax=Musa troglodytarum TaxID=320322 RepID=A0A9E7F417_9LILI|nr:Photosystem I reaction centre subunit N (PSAN or PSI-N) [Musa troglodytarum]